MTQLSVEKISKFAKQLFMKCLLSGIYTCKAQIAVAHEKSDDDITDTYLFSLVP